MGNEHIALSMAGKLAPIASLDDLDLKGAISDSLTKAESICQMTYGVNGDAFRGMSDVIQDNILWALSDFLKIAREATDELADRQRIARDADLR